MYGSSRYPGAGARVGSGSSWERGPTQLQAFIGEACYDDSDDDDAWQQCGRDS